MPSATVNRPTNIKEEEADINRKLQLYGIVTAFKNGKLPSNEQIDIALNSFLASRPMTAPSSKLSPEARALVKDLREVVEQAKVLLLTKNAGNLLQDLIWQSEHLEAGAVSRPETPVDRETAQRHAHKALEGLRTLGTLIITNGQFRKLLNDATLLLRDIAGDAATKAATKVKPSQEQLRHIDEPAEEGVWHDAPDISVDKLKGRFKTTKPTGAEGEAGAEAGTTKRRLSDMVSKDTYEQARINRERTQDYLAGKVPQERRDQTIWRLRKMVVEIQSHPDYAQAIDTLLYLAETYFGHAQTIGQKSTGAVQDARSNDALRLAEADLKTLIERSANGTSTDDLFDAINNIYRDADKDPELKSWFKHLNQYIRKCLQQQGYIMEKSATEEWNVIYDRGNFLLRDRYRNHTDRIVDEIKFLGDQFEQDPINKRFGLSMQKLFRDLGYDEYGKPALKPYLVKDLTEVIIPAAFENIRYVPIPRIEYSDPAIDAIVENLVIESDNLMPNIIEVANDNYFRYGRKKVANKNIHSVSVSVSGIQMDMRDVSYYVKRKQGSPKLTDIGIADIFLGGSGLSFKMKMSSVDRLDQQNFFKVDRVDVDVRNFKIRIKRSRHRILFALAKGMMLKVLRPAIQKVLEQKIKEQVHQLDSMAYQIKLEADRAKKMVAEHPEEAPNVYSRYVKAAQKQLMQGKQKTAEVSAEKKVNVTITKDDSIFPDIKLPGGISTKATEYKHLGMSGNKWESPIFRLGTASTTSDLPSVPRITRKPHPVTGGGLREPQKVEKVEKVEKLEKPDTAQAAAIATTAETEGFAKGLTPGDTSLFKKEVDKAFGKEEPSLTALDTGHTTLGANNPVLTGTA